MIAVALLPLLVYAAVKGGQLAFIGDASGYRGGPVGLARRVRKGEPMLLLVCILLAVSAVLAARWYHRHVFDAMLRNSLGRYGLVGAYRAEPAIMRTNDEHAMYQSFYGYRATALDSARQLGLTAVASQARLDAAWASAAGERVRADDALLRLRTAQTQRCLHPPALPANA